MSKRQTDGDAEAEGLVDSRLFAAIADPPLADVLALEVAEDDDRFFRSYAGLRRAFSSANGLSEWRQLPSKNAPASTANASCKMLPSTWHVEHKRIFRARMLPS